MFEYLTSLEIESLWHALQSAFSQHSLNRAEEILTQLRDLGSRLLSSDLAEHRAAVGFSAGTLATLRGRADEAEAAYRAAIPDAERSVAAYPNDVIRRDRLASMYYNVANILSSKNRHQEAEVEFRTALMHQETNLHLQPHVGYLRNHLAQTKFNLGNTLMSLGLLKESLRWFRQARELWIPLADDEPDIISHPHNIARSWFNSAYVEAWLGNLCTALEFYPKAQSLWERLLVEFGESSEQRCDVARCYYNHSLALAENGQQEEAVRVMRRAVPHFDRLVEIAPENATFANLREQTYAQLDRLINHSPAAVATRQLEQAATAAHEARSTGDWQRIRQVALSQVQLANDFCNTRHPLEMQQIYRASLALLAEIVPCDPAPATAHLEAAVWFDFHKDLHALGLLDAAEHAARCALRRWQHLHATHPDDPQYRSWLIGVHNHLGMLCFDSGRLAQAEIHYRVAIAMREDVGRSHPEDAENQLYLGGSLCNLGNLWLDRGDMNTARNLYQRALKTIEAIQRKLVDNPLVAGYLKNVRDGLAACDSRPQLKPLFLGRASVAWYLQGPNEFGWESEFGQVDRMRVNEASGLEQATRDLIAEHPDAVEAWLLRGLVVGNFRTQNAGQIAPWSEVQHEESVTAFYEALVCDADNYDALLLKGRSLAQAAHAAQAHYRVVTNAIQSLPDAERSGHLLPVQRRLQSDISRARESLEAAGRIRPKEGRVWYELASLYHGLGYRAEAEPWLVRLQQVDAGWWERVRGEFEAT
jgi:tetratricopeptide (TPR) repeat protein